MTLRTLAVAGLLLGAVGCTGPRGGSYAQATDSASAACQRNPAWCASVAGEEAVVPLRIRAAQVAAAGKAWQELDALARASILEILKECADQANTEVNLKRFGGQSPTVAQCREQMGTDSQGQRITRAMQLGEEKHRLALQCAQKKLDAARPGGFSLEQRYRLNSRTGLAERISPQEAEVLLRQGRGAELVGTVIPDVVIHPPGEPLRAQAVFDFKFPCPISNDPRWRKYPDGHPHERLTQGEAYEKVLGTEAFRVVPILGIL